MKTIRPDSYPCTHVAEGCADLPTRVIDIPGIGLAVQSIWELDGDELAQILQTKRIRLTVVGGQPPVKLEIVQPGEDD